MIWWLLRMLRLAPQSSQIMAASLLKAEHAKILRRADRLLDDPRVKNLVEDYRRKDDVLRHRR